MDSAKKKFAFIYLNTGGGHLAPAKAISEYLSKYHPDDTESVLINPFEKSSKLVRFIIEDGYRFLQNKAKWIYECIYALYKVRFISQMTVWSVSKTVEKYLTKIILDEKPDVIIICHFFCIHPVYAITKKHHLSNKIVTLVTDPYTAHAVWFLRKDQNFVLFSERLKEHCLKLHVQEENLHVFPFMLHEKFSHIATTEEDSLFRKKLHVGAGKIILVLGGGDGIPNGKHLLQNILQIDADFEIIFVCGKNYSLFKFASALKEEKGLKRLHVFGYVNFVYELISVSDIIISKCGASTFMEILLSRKVPVVNSYIWEQEKGNVDFLVENDLGIYERDIKKLTKIVERLLTDEAFYAGYSNRIKEFPFENGTKKVSEYLLSCMK
jgi:processive 1,2-diacylglycerol beta-glucosyltransferase/1,2-diacylglycerol 3-beta-galactosyltransferase